MKEITNKQGAHIYNKLNMYSGFKCCPICDSEDVIYIPHTYYIWGCKACKYGFFSQYFINGIENIEFASVYLKENFTQYHMFKVTLVEKEVKVLKATVSARRLKKKDRTYDGSTQLSLF